MNSSWRRLNEFYSFSCVRAVLCFFAALIFAPSFATAEPGVSKQRILIGYSVDLTGISSVNSARYRKGASLYFDLVNSKGGINGRTIKVIYYDDGYEPKVAYENVKKLIEQDKVFAIFQNYGSESAALVFPLIEKYDVPFIMPIASDDIYRNTAHRNVFNLRLSFSSTMNGLIKYAVQKLGIKQIAIISQDDSFGLGLRDGALKALKELGLKPVFDGRFPRKNSNLVEVVDDLIRSKAKAVVLAIQSNATTLLIEEATKQKYKPVYLGAAMYSSPSYYKKIEKYTPTIYFSSSFPIVEPESKIPVIQEFLNEAKKAVLEPDTQTFEGYFNAKVFVEALRLAGKNPTRDSLRAAFESMNNVDFGGITVNFSKTSHNGLEKHYIGTFKDGKAVQVN